MSDFKDLKTAVIRLDESTSIQEACAQLTAHVPKSFALRELAEEVSVPDNSRLTRRRLLALLACLRCDERVTPSSDNAAARRELANLVARSIEPIDPHVKPEGEEDVDDGDDDERNKMLQNCLAVGDAGLEILQLLFKGTSLKPDSQVLFTVIAFTDMIDPWTTDSTLSKAKEILRTQFEALVDETSFIGETILKDYLRPLFSKSRPPTVTASGRKAEYPEDADRLHGLLQDNGETKPWKYVDLRALPVFAWAVHRSSEILIRTTWPLFTPVLLTLLDDPDTPIRARGLDLLAALLAKFPTQTLRDAGLAAVFEQAARPALSYLPSATTPEADSLRLLPAAYGALLALARRMQVPGDADMAAARGRLLDSVLREGVFAGYFHSGEKVRIAEILVEQAGLVVAEMGLQAVKHLKDLIPLFSKIMTDPFATSYPPAVLRAAAALQATIACCWPRLATTPWRTEIVRTLVLCWLRFNEDDTTGREDVRLIRLELIKAARMLSAVAKAAGVDLAQESAPVVEKEPALAALFDDLP